jgi:hypothetical protein
VSGKKGEAAAKVTSNCRGSKRTFRRAPVDEGAGGHRPRAAHLKQPFRFASARSASRGSMTPVS